MFLRRRNEIVYKRTFLCVLSLLEKSKKCTGGNSRSTAE